jgi:hypothetical protein
MSSAKLVAAAAAGALALSACGSVQVQPRSGSASRGVIDDQRVHHPNHLACLKQAGLPAVATGQTSIQVGQPPAGPRIAFAASPGAAQALQIEGQAQGAEVIGTALLYPGQASDRELGAIEGCLAVGVQQ